MTTLQHALDALRQALDVPRRYQMWRWLVRHRIAGVHDALAAEQSRASDLWLAPREMALERERDSLIRRLSELSPQVQTAADVEPVCRQLHRLVADAERHLQRLNDLTYDTVALDLGGSE